MELEVTLLTHRGTATMRRSYWVNADRVRFGRGTNNEVPLADIRVELVAASLALHDGGLTIETRGEAPIQVNGNVVETAPVRPGDEVLVGPYKVTFTEPPANSDAACSIELAQPLGDALNLLISRSKLDLASAAFGKRTLSWIGFMLIFLVCLIGPMVVYFGKLGPSLGDAKPRAVTAAVTTPGIFTLSWNAGTLSNTHRQFATACAECHQSAFTAVPDKACLACHEIGSHVEKNVDLGKLHVTLNTVRCTTCHEEHRGLEGLIIREAALCINCHADLAETAPGTGMRNVDGFPQVHPQFRVTLVNDIYKGTLQRAELGSKPTPIDHPGLHFSHKAHLVKGGFPPLGYKEMKCADCHVAEPGGLGFLPITYDGQCKTCHALKFDRADLPWPNATVPHGDDSVVVSTVWNYFAGKTLEGGIADPQAPAVLRRAPGTPMPASPDAQKEALAWVSQKSLVTLKTVVLDDKRGCAYCHYGMGPRGTFKTEELLPKTMAQPPMKKVQIVAPVIMLDRFFPKAQFRHSSHAASACEDCHDARHSEDSRDVLIPGKETCLGCHGAERASLKSQSTCTTCHVFHHNEFGLMRETTAAATR